MFRFSFSVRQASKRLIAELASINARKEAADAKAKSSVTSATKHASSSSTTKATSASAADAEAAAVSARAAAEGAMPKKTHTEPVVATKLAKIAKRMRKQKAAKAEVTAGDHFHTEVMATKDSGETPLREAEIPAETVRKASPDADPPKTEGQQMKKKKKKLLKAASPPKSLSQVREEEKEASPPVDAPDAEMHKQTKTVHRKEEKVVAKAAAPAEASPSKPEKNDASQQKTPMIKAFRIEDVLSACTPDDGVFARRLPQGGCQFFAWPGTPLAVASNAVSTMPDTIRTVHAIFGRKKTPIDLVLDIDCPVPQEHWSMSKIRPFQKKVLDDIMTVVMGEIEAIGEKIASQVVLQSPNLKKASFHVHTKLKDVAFEDYESLHGFLYRFHKKVPQVDLQIYRQNGMLRMHRCMKENHTSAITVFEDKKWNIGFPNGVVPDPVAALHSACVRESGTYSRLLHFEAPRMILVPEEGADKDATGAANGASKIPPILLPLTEREAVENVSMWLRTGTREVDVGDWRSWIKLGINTFRIAYHFRDAQTLRRPAMEELLDAWVEASKKCPMKYRPGVCEAKWSSFDIDKLCKLQDNDWWSSYQRIGRVAALNKAADAGGATSATSSKKAEQK
ncbi:mitochondrial DNA primase [Trypanosoma cruzi Dm28c]|uniref:Mitochondrial DNA primase n=2 Tax=Trypanosoma cruzi TaxID=5693 RepID=V5D725_TRYCR|nr:mitochondrial DNA primase [Trypanosoma cruzi Dm28c]PBJ79649.1 mitochondrial DNA primase (PRI1) [Trypanosoma cruzi cruzi]PWU97241.1 putative mitochondrial DNA primase [Trypanosoma cruzi]